MTTRFKLRRGDPTIDVEAVPPGEYLLVVTGLDGFEWSDPCGGASPCPGAVPVARIGPESILKLVRLPGPLRGIAAPQGTD